VSSRPITFLSDYGADGEFAGVCRGVIARIAPEAAVIDLAHGVRPHAVREGATILANSLPYCPPGVHLAVVDPGVGSARRALAVRAGLGDRVLVGPDNGLLWPALERLGGATQAVDVSRSPVRLEPVSATFHGRDVFAPVAAHLAVGTSLTELGEEVGVESLASIPGSEPEIGPDRAACHVVSVDRFGNVALDLTDRHLPSTGLGTGKPVAVEVDGENHRARFALTFADGGEGELILYVDSYASLALAVNRGSAAEALGVRPGGRVVLRWLER
jgi:S-adenosyl-L-methionine hydrolase (adenosine-forming)